MGIFRVRAFALGVAAGVGVAAGLGWAAGALAAANPATELGLPVNVAAAMRGIDAERIRAHVKFLSHDLLEGRGTGARGGDIAAEYIAAQFALSETAQAHLAVEKGDKLGTVIVDCAR